MENGKEQLIPIFKERYDFEMDRKKAFASAVTIPITLVSFLVAGIFYTLVDDDLKDVEGVIAAMKWVILIPISMSCILTFVQLHKLYVDPSHRYQTLPSANEMGTDYSKLAECKETAGPAESLSLSSMMNENIIKWYGEVADHNFTINETRGTALQWAKKFISWAFIGGIVLIIFIGLVKSDLI